MTSAGTQDLVGDAGAENVGRGERALSLLAGAWLVARGVLRARRSPWSLLVALAGIPLVRRGATGHSATYQLFGIDTERRLSLCAGVDPTRAEVAAASVMIERPVGEVYEFWRRFENMPQFFADIDRVTRAGHGGWKWVAEGPLGRKLEWETEVTQDIALQRVAWRSRPGSAVAVEGLVEFHPIPGGTEVSVRLMYQPIAGRIGAQVAKFLGVDGQRVLVRDLARFKQILEARPEMLPEMTDQQLDAVPLAGADMEAGVDPAVARGRADIAEERDATLAERADFENDQSFPASDAPARY